MNHNIDLDDETGRRLVKAAEDAGETCNALIRQAVGDWLALRAQPRWPDAVIDFQGIADLPRFEAGREHQQARPADPLA